MKVKINERGKIDLLYKESGKQYPNEDSSLELVYFKDISSAERVDLNERKIEDIAFIGCLIKDIILKPKEIYSIAIR